MLERLRPHLTYANVMATFAAFVAVSTGGAYAVDRLDGRNLRDGSVQGRKLARDTLTGRQIRESRLGVVPAAASAARASTADRADRAGSADALGGVPASGFLPASGIAADSRKLGGLEPASYVRSCGDSTLTAGAVHGFALIKPEELGSSFTADRGVYTAFNCSGGSVQARESSYSSRSVQVRFENQPARLAVITEVGCCVNTPATFSFDFLPSESFFAPANTFVVRSSQWPMPPFVILLP